MAAALELLEPQRREVDGVRIRPSLQEVTQRLGRLLANQFPGPSRVDAAMSAVAMTCGSFCSADRRWLLLETSRPAPAIRPDSIAVGQRGARHEIAARGVDDAQSPSWPPGRSAFTSFRVCAFDGMWSDT
jgi:hypothetical protein